MKTYREVLNYEVNAIALNSRELFYLRLFAHNYNDNAIAAFLSLSNEALSIAKFGVKEKFKTTNWLNIMQTAQSLDILDPLDYVPEFVQLQAQLCVSNLVKISNFSTNDCTIDNLQNTLMEFYKTCRKIANNKRDKHNTIRTLTDMEKKYLVLKYSGFNEVSIIQTLNISARTIFKIKREVLTKLGTNSLFNAYRKAIDNGLIKKQTIESKALIDSSVKIARSINDLNISYIKMPQKNQKAYTQALYFKLLEFYTLVHYTILFKTPTTSLN
ncbi:hypothetical protein [uncultured Winogradskyella sp.]|uniref:helix-turn-helix transcriptional regulator n=1 Tax=uncultured Winogradskyella sp. TaxID=395353 RepID=UPI00261F1464|nr:hypothetical protein [uncultured Winogradskyella sp.]